MTGPTGSSQSVTVTPEDLLRASGVIGDIRNDINGILANLTRTVEGSVSSWDSGAATVFRGVMMEWDRSQKKLQDSLDQITQDLSTDGNAYAAVDQTSADSIKSVVGGSGLAAF